MGGDKHHKENKSGANNQNGDIGDPSLSDSPQSSQLDSYSLTKTALWKHLSFSSTVEQKDVRRIAQEEKEDSIMVSTSCHPQAA